MKEPARKRLNWIVGLTVVAAILATGMWLSVGETGFGASVGASGSVPTASGEGADAEARVLDRTLAFFEERYREDPRNPIAARELIDGYRRRFRTEARLDDLRRAEHIAETMSTVALDRAGFQARLATVRLDLHKFPEAYAAARNAVSANPASPSAQASLFDAAQATGRYAVAESALARLPTRSFAHRFREAQWLEAHGRLDEAVRSQRRACRELRDGGSRSQTVAWCLTQLAGLEGQRDGPEAEAALYRRALEIRPGYREAVEGLADLAYVQRRWEQAAELYRRILTDAHPDLHLRLAEVLDALDRPEAAATHEHEFLELASDSASEALFARPLAIYLADHGKEDRALSLIQRDLQRRPDLGGYEVLAWIHLRRGEPAKALEASDRARRPDAPGEPGATSDYHRARILEALGRNVEAQELLNRARTDATALDFHALQDLWARER